jgi:hypothetical protein
MKILFFSPHAYFSVHALPEALVAESLLLDGHDVVVVNCDRELNRHCLAMYGVVVDDLDRKAQICSTCIRHRDAITREFGFRTLMLDAFLSDNERMKVRTAVADLEPQTYLSWELDGVPVGRFSLYEFMLNHKLSSTGIPKELWPEYVQIFGNALTTYYAMRRIMAEQRPDRMTTYNSFYSVNRIACAVAEQFGIPHFTLHAGRHLHLRLQQMTIFKGIGTDLLVNRLPQVDTYRETPCTPEQVNIVTAHVRELLNAKSLWVYSTRSSRRTSDELYARFGIRDGQKVLLAAMRSADERGAAALAGVTHFDGNPLFKDQYAWLEWLVDFAREHRQYQIILRVHPREFPNKREQVTSQNAKRFLEFTENLDRPDNFHINVPQDNLSLHDLLKITDVVLNNTSTAGLEGALFGIPVVGVREEVFAFDLALQAEPTTTADYVDKIAQAAASGWSFSRVVTAYRWLNYLTTETSIDISDGYEPVMPSVKRSVRALRKLDREMRWLVGAKGYFPEVRNRNRPLTNASKLTYAITKDQNSHIGAFPINRQVGAAEEREQIGRGYSAIMESICDPKDNLFRARFEGVLSLDGR